MDIFKAGEGRIKYITLNNDIIKRSADRKAGRAFLYVYIYILAILKNRTILYKPYKRRWGKALRMYDFCYDVRFRRLCYNIHITNEWRRIQC